MQQSEYIPAVCVPFALTKRGKRTLEFAGDLARLLDRDLVVLMGANEARDTLARAAGVSSIREYDLIREAVVGLVGVETSRVHIEGCSVSIPKCSIRVTSESKSWNPDPSEITFFSAEEIGLFARGKGPIYITAGDKWTHPSVVKEAVMLAKKLGVGVVVYHTTWKVKDFDSGNPREHVSKDAIRVLSAMVAIAREADVPVEVVLEHAPTIVDGVIRHAIENGASVIVMTKSARARRGSYVDQVVAHSPVPVLVLPQSSSSVVNLSGLPSSMKDLPFFRRIKKLEPPKHIAYVLMAGVFLMYLIEVASKLKVGTYLNSPVIIGDGWHNVSDLF